MDGCRPVYTPIKDCQDFDTSATGCVNMVFAANGFPYLEAIGSIMYMMLSTCHGLAFAIGSLTGSLTQFCENLSLTHCNALKRALKYIKGAINLWLSFPGRDEIDLS